MFRPLRAAAACAAVVILAAHGRAADEPVRVLELRTQTVGDTTYFQARLQAPPDMLDAIAIGDRLAGTDGERRLVAGLPRLLPQDRKTHAVYLHLGTPSGLRLHLTQGVQQGCQIVEFVGRLRGEGKADLLLLYPTVKQSFGSAPVALDFAAARKVAQAARQRRFPHPDDLQGQWAIAQAAHLEMLEAQASGLGFYGFAQEATARKYQVPAGRWLGRTGAGRGEELRDLYDLTTGGSAIAESLAMRRLLGTGDRDRGDRTIDVSRVQGIDIAEHPWVKMMAGKKPSPEPLAKLVPHDNFYLHFKSVRKFIEFGELLDQWGTDLVRAYELTSRDLQLRQRYEKQLCLRSTALGKALGPALIRSLAVTGSDGYVREGTDLTVIFHVVNTKAFLAAVEGFLQEARKEFGAELKESKAEHGGVPVESFVTPLREVSLHRAVIDNYVVYSNSPVALRRVIDTHQGKRKALADSLDFQYMRTVFRLEDEKEDGFAFLSDAFIRTLVGPASKIKEKRRLEALASLSLVTNGALFTAWETGKLPADHPALLAAAALKPADVDTPEDKGVIWDAKRQAAVSDVFNTNHFVTPLIELPIDRITKREEADYNRFRLEYLGLWRRYFDPVGVRLGLNGQRVCVETYILPLIQNSEYNQLRRFTGNGTAPLDVVARPPTALVQFLVHLSPETRGDLRNAIWRLDKDPVGDWFFIRAEDSSLYAKLGELWLRQQLNPQDQQDFHAAAGRLICQLPITAGVRIGDERAFNDILDQLRALAAWLGATKEERLQDHKGVAVYRFAFTRESNIAQELKRGLPPGEEFMLPALFHAKVEGAWYCSLREECLRRVIDEVLDRKGKEPAKEKVEVNSSLHVAPVAADLAAPFLRSYLEWESHRRALSNGPAWHVLYRAGLITGDMSDRAREAAALRYLGFVPVSPDGAAYTYEAKTDEVVNRRHGTLRQPKLHPGVEESSSLGQLLAQLRTVRADLRFREDGVHTTVTIERKAPGK